MGTLPAPQKGINVFNKKGVLKWNTEISDSKKKEHFYKRVEISFQDHLNNQAYQEVGFYG